MRGRWLLPEVTLRSLLGACPDLTGGLSSEEFVRRKRDESNLSKQDDSISPDLSDEVSLLVIPKDWELDYLN